MFCTDSCPKYERYEKCPSAVCSPKRCDQLGFPITDCSNPDDKCPSEPGCICIEGYVRNDKGRCVPLKECRE